MSDQLPYTLQQVFNKAWQAFVVERKPASVTPMTNPDEGGNCMYRGPNCGKCAIGLSIPDEFYRPEMEDEKPYKISVLFPEEYAAIFGDIDPHILQSLQLCHDAAAFFNDGDFHASIEERLRAFAQMYVVYIPSESATAQTA